MEEKIEAKKTIKALIKNWKLIAILPFIGFFLAITLTFFIPKKYEAIGIIFPTNGNSSSGIMEDPRFGFGLDADQLMQLLESQMLRDSIIDKYNLIDYYEIDKTDLSWQKKLEKKYIKDIQAKKTKYFSILITAETKSPELSANIVNSIIYFVDEIKANIIRKNQYSTLDFLQTKYRNQLNIVDSIKMKIYENKKPITANDLLYNHLNGTKKNKVDKSDYYITDVLLENLVEEYLFQYDILKGYKIELSKAEAAISKPLPKVYTVSNAFINYKKSSPSYLNNSILGFLGGLVLAILWVILKSKFAEIKQFIKE